MHIEPSKPRSVQIILNMVLEKFRCGCFLLFKNMSFKCENMEVVLGQSLMVILMSVILFFPYFEGVCYVKYLFYTHLNM